MRNISKLAILLFSGILMFSGCTSDHCKTERSYLEYTPEYMSMEEFRASVNSEGPRELNDPGKIFFLQGYLFINERDKGVHVVDNTNPENPVFVSFINIPGNRDVAVKGNMLYADSYMDLVTIDITNPSSVMETSRLTNVFYYPERQRGVDLDFSRGVVKNWKSELKTLTEIGNCDDQRGVGFGFLGFGGAQNDDVIMATTSSSSESSGSGKGSNESGGIAGSMTSFALYSHYLYAINESEALVFDLSETTNPKSAGNLSLQSWGAETLFPYNGFLYVGAQTGMDIYKLDNPLVPTFVSTYFHITSCDPVVVENGTAYVTLRNGTPCSGFTNQLDIIDVSDPSTPTRIASHEMVNPHGLGIDNEQLFICDGDAGLKVFDVENPQNLKSLAAYAGIHAFDVIPVSSNELLIMIGEDGLYQYSYENINDVRQLSIIPVTKVTE